jgi:ABC-type sulfate transport system permease component
VYIYSRIESDDTAGAAAVSVVLLLIAVLVLTAFGLLERRAVRGR